jgi:Holliday junction resolvase RusA-like endonuclease
MKKPIKLVITGRPVTKKNHQQIVMAKGRPRIIQAKAYYVYAHSAVAQLKEQYQGKHPFKNAIAVSVQYWLPNRRGRPDLNNLLSATADLLEDAGVIENDHFIVSWDGSEIAGMDKNNPRAEITIRTNPQIIKKYKIIWEDKSE